MEQNSDIPYSPTSKGSHAIKLWICLSLPLFIIIPILLCMGGSFFGLYYILVTVLLPQGHFASHVLPPVYTNLLPILLCSLLLLGICGIFYSYMLHRHLIKPLGEISCNLQNICHDRPPHRLPRMHIRELQELADATRYLSRYIHSITLRSDKLRQEKERFINLSLTDALTGIGNRRSFELYLQTIKPDIPSALIMLDIDSYKKFNDLYGHQAGDDALCDVVQCVQNALLRNGDEIFRYGGEEFVILLPNANRDTAINICLHIQRNIRAMSMVHAAMPTGYLTVSMGIALSDKQNTTSHEEWIEYADKALYLAKRLGRNRICVHGEEESIQLIDNTNKA